MKLTLTITENWAVISSKSNERILDDYADLEFMTKWIKKVDEVIVQPHPFLDLDGEYV